MPVESQTVDVSTEKPLLMTGILLDQAFKYYDEDGQSGYKNNNPTVL
jgi:hypothetical protein